MENLLKIERAEIGPQNQQADDEARVADAVGDECLVGGVGSAVPFVVETDQQVRANAHQFPAYENLEEVIGQDQHNVRRFACRLFRSQSG